MSTFFPLFTNKKLNSIDNSDFKSLNLHTKELPKGYMISNCSFGKGYRSEMLKDKSSLPSIKCMEVSNTNLTRNNNNAYFMAENSVKTSILIIKYKNYYKKEMNKMLVNAVGNWLTC